jgi:hypothetical protein
MTGMFTDELKFTDYMKPEDFPKITKYRLVKRSSDATNGTWFLQFQSKIYFLGFRTFISVWRYVPEVANKKCFSESTCPFRGFPHSHDYVSYGNYKKNEYALEFTQYWRDIKYYFKKRNEIMKEENGPIYL